MRHRLGSHFARFHLQTNEILATDWRTNAYMLSVDDTRDFEGEIGLHLGDRCLEGRALCRARSIGTLEKRSAEDKKERILACHGFIVDGGNRESGELRRGHGGMSLVEFH
jgi:hypothetical protein